MTLDFQAVPEAVAPRRKRAERGSAYRKLAEAITTLAPGTTIVVKKASRDPESAVRQGLRSVTKLGAADLGITIYTGEDGSVVVARTAKAEAGAA